MKTPRLHRPVLAAFCLAVALFGLGACASVEIVGSTPDRVWIRNTFFDVMGTHTKSDEAAQAYCAQHGKTAALETDLALASQGNSILVYTCQ